MSLNDSHLIHNAVDHEMAKQVIVYLVCVSVFLVHVNLLNETLYYGSFPSSHLFHAGF